MEGEEEKGEGSIRKGNVGERRGLSVKRRRERDVKREDAYPVRGAYRFARCEIICL